MSAHAPATRPAPVVPACDRCGQTAHEQLLAPSGAFLCPSCFHGSYGAGEKHEAQRLFTPAPAVPEGQIVFGYRSKW